MSSSQSPGTQQNRDDQKVRPQGGQQVQDQDSDQKEGSTKDPRGNAPNPDNDSDRTRQPGQKSGQS